MQKIFQIILFILLSLIFTEEDIPIYNLNPFENIEIENQTSSCICFKMSDEIKNGDFFYAIIYTNELYVSINETLRFLILSNKYKGFLFIFYLLTFHYYSTYLLNFTKSSLFRCTPGSCCSSRILCQS